MSPSLHKCDPPNLAGSSSGNPGSGKGPCRTIQTKRSREHRLGPHWSRDGAQKIPSGDSGDTDDPRISQIHPDPLCLTGSSQWPSEAPVKHHQGTTHKGPGTAPKPCLRPAAAWKGGSESQEGMTQTSYGLQ